MSLSARPRLSDLLFVRRVVIAAVVAIVAGALAANAGTFEVFAGAVGGENRAFGSLTPTDWRLQAGRGLNAGFDWYFTDHLSAEFSAIQRQEFIHRSGERLGEFRSVSMAGVIQAHGSLTARVEPYLGVGAAYLKYGGRRVTAYGTVEQPDHAALVISGGTNYVISPHWRLMFGAEYGPARSTAEIKHPGLPTEQVDFHQLYITTGLRYRF